MEKIDELTEMVKHIWNRRTEHDEIVDVELGGAMGKDNQPELWGRPVIRVTGRSGQRWAIVFIPLDSKP